MKLALRKKAFAMKKSYFQSIISLHALKLALNKSMRASDDEQVINKLRPYINEIVIECVEILESFLRNSSFSTRIIFSSLQTPLIVK